MEEGNIDAQDGPTATPLTPDLSESQHLGEREGQAKIRSTTVGHNAMLQRLLVGLCPAGCLAAFLIPGRSFGLTWRDFFRLFFAADCLRFWPQ